MLPRKANKSQPSKRSQSRRGNPRQGATQGDGPAYAGQPTVRLVLPGVLTTVSTTVTTGVIANVDTISIADISGFTTRFGSTFDEYRILGATFKIRPTGVNPGITRFWFDEKSSATPTVDDSYERVGLTLSNNSSDSRASTSMTWKARDLLDLQYTPIGTASTPAYFKIYTDNASYASPATVLPLWFRQVDLLVEFRGLKTV
jgi:hypothetical protein